MRSSRQAAPARVGFLLLGLALGLGACRERAAQAPDVGLEAAFTPLTTPADLAGDTWLDRKAPGRIVAIGDIHGDLEAARAVLRLVGAIDGQDRWSGGDLVVVQTGDQLDRGPDDRAVLDLFARLEGEAARAGGACLSLNGNHELGNALGYHRAASAESLKAFDDITRDDLPPGRLGSVPPEERGRSAAFLPGGPYARMLAGRPVVARVNDSIFVHGGLEPHNLDYGLAWLNAEVRAWLLAERPEAPAILSDRERAPTWIRRYSLGDPGPEDCQVLAGVLARLGARRMVVGHTVQDEGINPACGGLVWRIDVGLSKVYGGPHQTLVIDGQRVEVRTEPSTAGRRPGPQPIPRVPTPLGPEPKTP
jgi:hypothetical protein